MSITVFDKLVRDKIPEIIRRNNAIPTTRFVADDEYREYLGLKLTEEVNEFLEENDTKELADVLEVVRAICDAYGVPFETVEQWRAEKYERRGGFSDGVILLTTEDTE